MTYTIGMFRKLLNNLQRDGYGSVELSIVTKIEYFHVPSKTFTSLNCEQETKSENIILKQLSNNDWCFVDNKVDGGYTINTILETIKDYCDDNEIHLGYNNRTTPLVSIEFRYPKSYEPQTLLIFHGEEYCPEWIKGTEFDTN